MDRSEVPPGVVELMDATPEQLAHVRDMVGGGGA